MLTGKHKFEMYVSGFMDVLLRFKWLDVGILHCT